MASRRSHAPSHNITSISTRYKITYYSRVPRGHVYIRNPLQAPKERSCGINNPLHTNLVPRSGTDYHPQHHTGCVSPPSGNYMGWNYRTYPQRRCFAACSGFHDIGPAPWNPQLIVIHKQTIYKQKKALCQVGEKLVRARPNIKPFT